MYFDDLKVMVPATPTVDTEELEAAITEATTLHTGAVVGNAQGQWSEGAKTELQKAIADAQAVLEDDEAEQEQVDEAVTALAAAVQTFNDRVNQGNVTFYYSFEDAEQDDDIDLRTVKGTLDRVTEKAYSGSYSYKVNEDEDEIRFVLDTLQTNCIVSVMFYDNMHMGNKYTFTAGWLKGVYIGYNGDLPDEDGEYNKYYGWRNCATGSTNTAWQITSVARSEGWHELKWDFTSGTSCVVYIDNKEVGRVENLADWQFIDLGDSGTSAGAITNMYFDDLKIMVPAP